MTTLTRSSPTVEQRAGASTSSLTDPTTSTSSLYESALVHARAQEYEPASQQFEKLLTTHPGHVKAWISYAQMSKKSVGRMGQEAGQEACQSVLRRAMEHNPDSGMLHQAAGLSELQCGRPVEALGLLQKAVQLQPSLAPVLKWKNVQEAAQQIGADVDRSSSRNSTND